MRGLCQVACGRHFGAYEKRGGHLSRGGDSGKGFLRDCRCSRRGFCHRAVYPSAFFRRVFDRQILNKSFRACVCAYRRGFENFYFRALSSHCFADEGHKAHLYVPRGGTPHHQLLRARTSPYRGKRAEVFDASQPLRNHFSVFRYGGVHFGVFAGYLDSGASWVG